MKATNMLNQVKELLGVETTKEVKLAQATLENGTVIESEQFAEGSEVFIVTEDEKVALPIGEYTLQDGEILIIEEEGIIASIGAAEKEAEEEVEEEIEAGKEEVYATKEELNEVLKVVEEIKSMLQPKEEEMSEDGTSGVKSEETTTKVVYSSKDDLSEQVPVEKIRHNPEGEAKKQNNLYSQKRSLSTLDTVMRKLANK
tara:strand:- start:3807 stop:4406 length:600 start_codon:yes stop_codon:yes gene_type:complete